MDWLLGIISKCSGVIGKFILSPWFKKRQNSTNTDNSKQNTINMGDGNKDTTIYQDVNTHDKKTKWNKHR